VHYVSLLPNVPGTYDNIFSVNSVTQNKRMTPLDANNRPTSIAQMAAKEQMVSSFSGLIAQHTLVIFG
jgi:hypothetical protein